ncbi:polysaccharide deacetylase family protein [Shimia sp. SK013]|uniref:polysaccharide deacetylase family protein n=1 Tax=Shimia sp. SK013 TaxID=1389006 RepID=UPI001F4CFF2C|nr:polysaccharide deacetylase family protein [Shimia sp. SK013]
MTFPLWWRDDDAVAPTAALDKLETLSAKTGAPVHLAVIPHDASEDLARSLSDKFVPVVHGWAHANNQAEGKKAEFGDGRDPAAARVDMQQSIARMKTLFGVRLAPMFVPPWNRFDPNLLPTLAALGFDALSTYLPRKVAEPVAGVTQINTHIDPIFWRGTRGLVAPETLVAQTVALLQARRAGTQDNDEPLGYLTHHLVHDADIWEFSHQFLQEMCDGPVRLYRHDEKGFS